MILSVEETWQAQLVTNGLFNFDRLNAAQLYYVARTVDPEELVAASFYDNPLCDLSTALTLYKRLGSGFYQNIDLNTSGIGQHPSHRELINRINSGFFQASLFFYDPLEDGGIYGYENRYEDGTLIKKWSHPQAATQRIDKEKVEEEEAIEVFAILYSDGENLTFCSIINAILAKHELESDELEFDGECLGCVIEDSGLCFFNFEIQKLRESSQYRASFDFGIGMSRDESESSKQTFSGLGTSIIKALNQAVLQWEKASIRKVKKLF
jgi:hypothetical protein